MEDSARASVVFAAVLTVICATSLSPVSEVKNPPRRPLLTTSRVHGFPEPPPPFRTRCAFPLLTFDRPVYFAHEPGTDRVVVVEQGGKILAFKPDRDVGQTELFHQIKGHETYSITFHPRYAENGYVYVFCNGNARGHVKDRIFRYHVPHGSQTCDAKSERLIIEWDSNGHNGGDLAFGLDGYLYLTSGDGTSDSDGNVTGQDLSDLASAIIRIDVDHPDGGKAYAVPKDNPFLKQPGARPEIWAFGLRNPWRMSLDRETGNLWVGDVGQDLWEMIRLVKRGANYGWSVYEGNHPFRPERKLGPGPVVFPVMEHPHAEARSITGGFVYRGSRWPELRGVYVYGDYATGKIWGLRYADGKVTWRQELANTRLAIVGFGHDRSGELYIVDYGGRIHELERAPADAR